MRLNDPVAIHKMPNGSKPILLKASWAEQIGNTADLPHQRQSFMMNHLGDVMSQDQGASLTGTALNEYGSVAGDQPAIKGHLLSNSQPGHPLVPCRQRYCPPSCREEIRASALMRIRTWGGLGYVRGLSGDTGAIDVPCCACGKSGIRRR